jgi:hypothetical protein
MIDNIKHYNTFTTKYVFLTKEEEEYIEKEINQEKIAFEKAKIEFTNNCKNDPNYKYKVLYLHF